ncbi:LysR family transcriptional regulator [Marinomonas sp. 5E14-1]|uniref:LysR family transcriptional regulator n=1 Tax=Marinomonas sp. 5E14-1 TaxID=3153922 RepID=UPI003263C59F
MKKTDYFELSLLDNFIVISESNSLTDAGNRIGVSQSAISQSLKNLETIFGVDLVIRRSSPIKLTPAGMMLKKHSDSILNDIRKLKYVVREAAEKGLPHCRVGAITSFVEVFGSLFVKDFQKSNELLTLQSGSTPILNQAFLNRELDILISDDPMIEENDVIRFEIFRDPLVLVAKENLLKTSDFSIDKLSNKSSMVKYNRQTNIGLLIELALRRMELAPQVKFETDDSHTFMNFVRDSNSWGMMTSLCLLQAKYQLEEISVVELDKSRHFRTLYLIARKDELGELPEEISEIAINFFVDKTFLELNKICPWFTLGHFL